MRSASHCLQTSSTQLLAQMNTLIALTYGGEFTITSGNDTAITPTNISVKIQVHTAATGSDLCALVPKSCLCSAQAANSTQWRTTLTVLFLTVPTT